MQSGWVRLFNFLNNFENVVIPFKITGQGYAEDVCFF